MVAIPLQLAAEQLGIGKRKIFECLRNHHLLDANNHPVTWVIDQGLITTFHSRKFAAGQWRDYYRPMVTETGMNFLEKNKTNLFQ